MSTSAEKVQVASYKPMEVDDDLARKFSWEAEDIAAALTDKTGPIGAIQRGLSYLSGC